MNQYTVAWGGRGIGCSLTSKVRLDRDVDGTLGLRVLDIRDGGRLVIGCHKTDKPLMEENEYISIAHIASFNDLRLQASVGKLGSDVQYVLLGGYISFASRRGIFYCLAGGQDCHYLALLPGAEVLLTVPTQTYSLILNPNASMPIIKLEREGIQIPAC